MAFIEVKGIAKSFAAAGGMKEQSGSVYTIVAKGNLGTDPTPEGNDIPVDAPGDREVAAALAREAAKQHQRLEATIEGTSCDAAVKIFALTCFLRLLGFHDQDITLLHDIEIFRSEARDRHLNAIAVLTALDDIVRRPGFDGLQTLGVCQKIEDPVEADAGPEQGCEVEFVSHDQNLRKASWNKGADFENSDEKERSR